MTRRGLLLLVTLLACPAPIEGWHEALDRAVATLDAADPLVQDAAHDTIEALLGQLGQPALDRLERAASADALTRVRRHGRTRLLWADDVPGSSLCRPQVRATASWIVCTGDGGLHAFRAPVTSSVWQKLGTVLR